MQFYGFSKSTQVVKSIWSRYHRFLKAHCRAIHGMQGAFAVSGQITKRCQLHDIFIELVYVRVMPAALKLEIKREM